MFLSSNPDVGSSNMIILEFAIITRAIPNRFTCPPEKDLPDSSILESIPPIDSIKSYISTAF